MDNVTILRVSIQRHFQRSQQHRRVNEFRNPWIRNGTRTNGEILLQIQTRVTVLTIQNEANVHVRFLRLDIENRGVVIRWIAKSGLVVNESLYELLEPLDGSWHSVSLNLPGNFSLNELVAPEGQIILGGSATEMFTVHSLVERQVPDETTILPSDEQNEEPQPTAGKQ